MNIYTFICFAFLLTISSTKVIKTYYNPRLNNNFTRNETVLFDYKGNYIGYNGSDYNIDQIMYSADDCRSWTQQYNMLGAVHGAEIYDFDGYRYLVSKTNGWLYIVGMAEKVAKVWYVRTSKDIEYINCLTRIMSDDKLCSYFNRCLTAQYDVSLAAVNRHIYSSIDMEDSTTTTTPSTTTTTTTEAPTTTSG